MAKISHTKIKQPSFGEKRPKLTYTKISRFTVEQHGESQMHVSVWVSCHCWVKVYEWVVIVGLIVIYCWYSEEYLYYLLQRFYTFVCSKKTFKKRTWFSLSDVVTVTSQWIKHIYFNGWKTGFFFFFYLTRKFQYFMGIYVIIKIYSI